MTLRTWSQTQDDSFKNFANEAVDGNALELAVAGKGNEALHGGKNSERKPPGLAGDDLAGSLALGEDRCGVPKSFLADVQQFARCPGPVFGLEHQPEQSRMLQGEADKRMTHFRQTLLEIVPTVFGRTTQGHLKPLESAQCQGVQKCLLIGEVASG